MTQYATLTLTGDPEHDFFRHDNDYESAWGRILGRQPVCPLCNQPIVPDEDYNEIQGEYYHTDCLIADMKVMGIFEEEDSDEYL